MKPRFFGLLLFAICGLAQASPTYLAGCWRNVRAGYAPCYIQQQGNELYFTNENGTPSRGYFTGPRQAVAVDWGYLRLQIDAVGNFIYWPNNGLWQRDHTCD